MINKVELEKIKKKIISFIYHPVKESYRYFFIFVLSLPDSKLKINLTVLIVIIERFKRKFKSGKLRIFKSSTFKLAVMLALIAPFLYYILSLITNTLKFESTFLILFFLMFISLLYVNGYNYINIELDKYAFNTYLTYKETVARRIKRLRSNVVFFRARKDKLKSIVKKLSKIIGITYVQNFNHFKLFAQFTLIFFVYSFAANLTEFQLNFNKA